MEQKRYCCAEYHLQAMAICCTLFLSDGMLLLYLGWSVCPSVYLSSDNFTKQKDQEINFGGVGEERKRGGGGGEAKGGGGGRGGGKRGGKGRKQ